MSERYDIEICVTSEARHLCVIRAAVGAAAAKMGFEQGVCGQMMLAVDEAVTNVIRHGYGNAADKPIWVRMKPTDAHGRPGFTIVVDDLAKQVDPGTICGRDLDDVRPGGLGVHIIRKIMDEVEYSRREGGGMRLLMSKTAPSPTGTPSTQGN
ncbi:MAG: ATP-binding protein [Phycisphaeraceae bacterium]